MMMNVSSSKNEFEKNGWMFLGFFLERLWFQTNSKVKNENLRNQTSYPKESARKDGTIFVACINHILKHLKIKIS